MTVWPATRHGSAQPPVRVAERSLRQLGEGASPIVRAATDRTAGGAEQPQHRTHDHQHEANGPEDRDGEQQPEQEEDDSKNNHDHRVPVGGGPQTPPRVALP